MPAGEDVQMAWMECRSRHSRVPGEDGGDAVHRAEMGCRRRIERVPGEDGAKVEMVRRAWAGCQRWYNRVPGKDRGDKETRGRVRGGAAPMVWLHWDADGGLNARNLRR